MPKVEMRRHDVAHSLFDDFCFNEPAVGGPIKDQRVVDSDAKVTSFIGGRERHSIEGVFKGTQ